MNGLILHHGNHALSIAYHNGNAGNNERRLSLHINEVDHHVHAWDEPAVIRDLHFHEQSAGVLIDGRGGSRDAAFNPVVWPFLEKQVVTHHDAIDRRIIFRYGYQYS